MVSLSAAALVGAGVCATMLVLGVIDVSAALQSTVLTAVCGSVVLLALLVRRNSAQVRLLRRGLDRHVREIAEIAGENRAELFSRADDLSDRMAAVQESVGAPRAGSAPSADEPVHRFAGGPGPVVLPSADHVYADEDARELVELLRPGAYMPELGGAESSPAAVLRLVEAVRERRPELVVECGGGASTVWVGLALLRFGTGRLVSLEPDGRYAGLVRAVVAAHGLDGVVEVRAARDVGDLHDIDLVYSNGSADEGTGRGGEAVPDLASRCALGALVLPREDGHGDLRERVAAGAPVPSRAAS